MRMRCLKDEFGNIDKRYMIAKDGSYIRDKETGEKLIPHINCKGYMSISITINRIRYSGIKVSILQWRAWRGIIPKNNDIHHAGKDKNGNFNKLNDHIYCLKCLTHNNHKSLHSSGKNNPMFGKKGKLSPTFGKPGSMLGRTGDLCPAFGKPGPWLGKFGKEHPVYGMTGEKSHSSILTESDRNEIFYLRYIKKIILQDIANKFNVSVRCISHVLCGTSWNPKHLTKKELKDHFLKNIIKSRRAIL